MKLMVAQVFNLCTGGVLLSPGGTGFQPVFTGQRPVPLKGVLTTEFGMGLGDLPPCPEEFLKFASNPYPCYFFRDRNVRVPRILSSRDLQPGGV